VLLFIKTHTEQIASITKKNLDHIQTETKKISLPLHSGVGWYWKHKDNKY